jgi:hypothetical protein
VFDEMGFGRHVATKFAARVAVLKRMQLEAEPVYRAFSRALAHDSSAADLAQAVVAIVGPRS